MLARPDLFSPADSSGADLAAEYLALCDEFPPPDFKVEKLHCYKFLFPALGADAALEARLGAAASRADLRALVDAARAAPAGAAAATWYRRRRAPRPDAMDAKDARRRWHESGSGGRCPC